MGSATPAWRLPNEGLQRCSIAVLGGPLATYPDKLPQELVFGPCRRKRAESRKEWNSRRESNSWAGSRELSPVPVWPWPESSVFRRSGRKRSMSRAMDVTEQE